MNKRRSHVWLVVVDGMGDFGEVGQCFEAAEGSGTNDWLIILLSGFIGGVLICAKDSELSETG